jgi:pimeloyl-ACP methyl ester carboxylesterase
MRQPVEHRFAASAGEICWFEWGHAGDGPSLLLLHATGFHARCWDRVIAGLPEGLHIVAPDLRGHGRSFRPKTLGDWSRIADDMVELACAVIPGRFVAAGHSMGGCIALRIAADLPEQVETLLLIDPVIMDPVFYEGKAGSPQPDTSVHPVSRRRNHFGSADDMIAHFADRFPYSQWWPEILADYCRYGLAPVKGEAGYELACPPRLEASAYLGNSASNPHDLPARARCPAIVLRARNGERAGLLDFSISPTWPDLAEAFREGQDVQWSDCSHFIPMEEPARLATMIEVLF